MGARRLLWLAIVLLFATIAILAPIVIVRESTRDETAEAAAPGSVVMEKIAFSPTTLTVRPGTEVLFDNRDVAPHTVTSPDAGIDSGVINPGKAFRLVVTKAFDYICDIHPAMKAKIQLG